MEQEPIHISIRAPKLRGAQKIRRSQGNAAFQWETHVLNPLEKCISVRTVTGCKLGETQFMEMPLGDKNVQQYTPINTIFQYCRHKRENCNLW